MAFHVIPFHSISYHFIPCHFMSFRRIAFNPTSFHVISCHSMSFHLIPFCPMSFHVFDACMHSCIYSRHCFYVISQAWKKLFVYCARIAISLGVTLSMWAQARATPAAALVKGCSVHITPQKKTALFLMTTRVNAAVSGSQYIESTRSAPLRLGSFGPRASAIPAAMRLACSVS